MWEGGKGLNCREEGCEGGCEGRSWKVRGKRILEAVEVMVEDGHFPIEMVGKCLGGCRVGVHGRSDGRRDICGR